MSAASRRKAAAREKPATEAPLLRLVALIGSPVALVTALLFYFGWVRTSVQAKALGYDASIMDLSVTDYVIKSVNVLSVPLVLLLILAVALRLAHEGLLARADRSPRTRAMLGRVARLLGLSWIAWAVIAVLLMAFVPVLWSVALPLTLTAALLCVFYGKALGVRMTDAPPHTVFLRVSLLVLLAFAVFWDTERLAQVMGRGFAAELAADESQLVAVTVYSTKSLDIVAPGVRQTRLTGTESLYQYRYDGLRLVQRSGDRYFILNDPWQPGTGKLIVLRDNDAIRLEFRR